MIDDRTKRIGDNEALYRQVNERIKEMNEDFALFSETFSIACECGNVDCMERINISAQRYESTRQSGTRFIVVPGHEEPETELIVDRGDASAYVIVEKTAPEARRRAEEADPRS